MLNEPTHAIVLQTRNWMNTSLIVDFYTRRYGRLTAVARGARRLAATTRGTIQKLTLAEALFYPRNRGPATLASFEPISDLTPTNSLTRYLAAEAVAEHLLVATPQMMQDEALWEMATSALLACRDGTDAPSVVAAYLLKALKNEGVLAEVDTCGVCGAELAQQAWYQEGRFLCGRCLAEGEALKVEPALLRALLELPPHRLMRLNLGAKRAANIILFADALFGLHFQTSLPVARRLAVRLV